MQTRIADLAGGLALLLRGLAVVHGRGEPAATALGSGLVEAAALRGAGNGEVAPGADEQVAVHGGVGLAQIDDHGSDTFY
ncbi:MULTISPECIES: hypothetical protein [unclassified Undibacterium]|uniref:hypothetical protein n=1 Tax=unclassified Undibacterium TaxID=2630295 RepID=UPI002AC990CE|nr:MULTISPECIES: hypothetical protein [unclassified Undibacterium]MEB0215528.1 hypothetical protein [Undibacterium sp. 5I2]MEB0140699.1 hypothetical protein [Undibacterium sp. CCC2.1]MEB0172316.1 hypothetical protein [Undibacterium sp. CCC1.1]MEB0176232.1 hypothetical protein [Undibacterium sp. CCC3.4]WPX44325.1 hypothetical protein RHM61_03590 [Undibacterium sp. CCC3.4]